MAKSTLEQLDDAVIRVVQLARELTDGQAVSVGMDYAASGEYTYRIHTPEEALPIPGLARAEPEGGDTAPA